MATSLPRHARRLFAAALIGFGSSSIALAGDPATEQLRDQQRTFRQLEQEQRLQQWQRRAYPGPAQGRVGPSDAPANTAAAPCWPFKGVRLTGNQRLSTAVLEAALSRTVKPCMGVADLNAVLLAITERYVQSGYPVSRPYLAHLPQAHQPLDIVIVEGFVESIELPAALPLSLGGAFPDMLGQPLLLPDLEQGLDQLNRLRAYEVSADLLPGDQVGATRVVLQSRQTGSRWHLDSRLDNRGSELTGRHRLSLTAGLDSPLGLNDDLRMSVTTAIAGPGRSEGGSLYYSLPYGRWSVTLSAGQQSYRAPAVSSDGNSSQYGLSVERLLWRNAQGMLGSSLRLDHKRLSSRSSGAQLTQQSPTLTTLEAGLNLFWIEGGLWNAYLGIAQGVSWFGADREPLTQQLPDPAFRKYRASLLHLRQGPAQAPWRWQSELSLQYSPDLLHAVEQIVLSDDQAVRGFRQHNAAGASGAVWRNTLSRPLPMSLPVEVRPSVGLDLGWTQFDHGKPFQRLAGASVGLTLSAPGHRLRFDYQHPLHASNVPRHHLERGFWIMEWALSL